MAVFLWNFLPVELSIIYASTSNFLSRYLWRSSGRAVGKFVAVEIDAVAECSRLHSA